MNKEYLKKLFTLLETDDIKMRKILKSDYYKIFLNNEAKKILFDLDQITHESLTQILREIRFKITDSNHIEFKGNLSNLDEFNIIDKVYKSIINKFGYISHVNQYDHKGIYYTFKNNKSTIIFDKNMEYSNIINALGVFYKDSDRFIFDVDFMNKYDINEDLLKDTIVDKIELNNGVDKIKDLLSNNYNNLKELIYNINNINI